MPALAHTLGSGGPEIEVLLLGGAFLVLAIVFFLQKTASTLFAIVLALVGISGVVGAFAFGGSSDAGPTDITIAIASPPDGTDVPAGESVPVEIELEGGELAAESSDEDAGHLHVYVDGQVVSMPSELTAEVELEQGEHELSVEFVDAGHQPYDPPVTDAVTVTAR